MKNIILPNNIKIYSHEVMIGHYLEINVQSNPIQNVNTDRNA